LLENEAITKWGSFKTLDNKPNDFESFWKNGKKQVDSLSFNFSLVKSELYSIVAEAYDLYFVGINNAKIHAQLVQPKDPIKPMPVLFQFHGYHGNAGDWGDKIAYAAEGILVVTLNVRGQGGQSEDTTISKGGTIKGHIIRGVEEGPENLLYRQVYLDIYQLIQIVTKLPNIDLNHLYAYGASQGGALALLASYFEPKIKQVFCLYPFLSIFREAFKLDVEDSAYEELAYWFRYRDPQHKQELSFFKTLDYIDLQFFTSNIQAKVLWGIGLEDRVCHPKLQMGIYNTLKSEKEMMFLPEYGHEYIPEFSDAMRKKIYLDLNKDY